MFKHDVNSAHQFTTASSAYILYLYYILYIFIKPHFQGILLKCNDDNRFQCVKHVKNIQVFAQLHLLYCIGLIWIVSLFMYTPLYI